MKKVMIGLVVCCAVAAGRVQAADEAVAIPQVKEFPSVTGEWAGAVKGLLELPFGKLAVGDGKTEAAVRAFAGYKDDELYVLMIAAEPAPDKIVAAHTNPETDRDSRNLWKDDCVQLFLANTPANWNAYYQIIVNPKGVVYDTKAEGANETDLSWSSDAKVKSSMVAAKDGNPAYWITEIRLPFKNLGGAPKRGTFWQINLTRERKVGGQEDFSWAPIEGSFHQPELFRKVFFGEVAK